jgi:hypothetical protein
MGGKIRRVRNASDEGAIMNPQPRTIAKKNAFVFWIMALFIFSLACSLTAGQSDTPSSGNSNAQSTSSLKSTATARGAEGAQTESGKAPTEALSKSFPLPAGAEIDPETISEADPGRGSFTLRSNTPLGELADFYKTGLPAQGWNSRYTDANEFGGVTQFWKKESVYLSLQFGYDAAGAVVKIKYQSVAADALEKLPADFPVPDKSELTNALDTTWDFYVDQGYTAVIAFYTKASADWEPCSGYGNEGEGDDGGGSKFPAGVTPMPSPTRDSRPAKSYCWVLPSQNQVELYIRPHGDATLLHVYVTSLNPSDSGLPPEIPIFPGAKIQSAEPGSVTFMAGAGLEKVKAFYQEKLTAAGWTLDGQPIEAEGTVMMNWKEGAQTVMIVITAMGENDCLVMIAYEES